ncbi:helix-turn-helix domain-containing protein [Elizabethkingia meningoseptica]|nr:helix-turn-helix domain-containing protein [Elizabethkingia meningoseptica]MDE5509551.1 helix-turn-helix domain-containing protein [Elizabethkingia meningoseptica]MDE5516854.1 helix-turn-helix domain-containing protein [Elizabethkingia meningoseptica]MDE5527359.1 helix-turn-helix domain-containing protein [Elizabethkingia meningoseptica]MDE5531094.1 helix-turn-helix domain-containing protein [Elizabethkingia meningoseptica]
MPIENIQNFVLVLLYGSLVLQSFILVVNPMNVNKKANFAFGIFLFLWSSYWLQNILQICGLFPNPQFIFLIRAFEIFTPLFLFFSVVFFITPNYRFKKNDLFCLITPVAYLFLLLNSGGNKLINIITMLIAVVHNLPYIAIIYFKIRKHQKRIETISSDTESINLQWLIKLSLLLFITIVITVCYELFNAFIYKMHQNLAMDLLFLFIVYSTFYHILRQKEIYPVSKMQLEELLSIELESEEKTEKKKLIPDQDFEALKQKLLSLMETQKPYLDGELNLLKLSELININAHQLSYLMNNGFNENFFQFVNKYRVEYAKKLLSGDPSKKFSILGIAFESGFNSKTSFNTIFKKTMGITPSEFRKSQEENNFSVEKEAGEIKRLS